MDTNEAFYRAPVTAQELLSGAIPPPPQADILYRALNMKASDRSAAYSGTSESPGGSFYRDEYQQFSNGSPTHSPGVGRSASTTQAGRIGNSQEAGSPSMGGRGRSSTKSSAGYAFSNQGNSNAGGYVGLAKDGSARDYRASTGTSLIPDLDDPAPSYSPTAAVTTPVSKFSNKPLEGMGNSGPGYGRPSSDNNNPFSSAQDPMNASIANKKSSSFSSTHSRSAPPPPTPSAPPAMGAKPTFVTALYDFAGEQPTDLSFSKGDRIAVVKKTRSTNDWWTGRLSGKEGSFPANYVQ